MKVENIFLGAISITIAVIMIAGALLPVIFSSTAEADTYTNDGLFKMGHTDTDIPRIDWSADKPYIITVKSINRIDMSNLEVGVRYTIFASSIFAIDYMIMSNESVQIYGYSDSAYFTLSSTDSESWLVLQSYQGAVSAIYRTNGENVTVNYTQTPEGYYYISHDGNLVLKNSNESCFLSKDSEIALIGIVTRPDVISNKEIGILGTGTYDNLNFSFFYGSGVTPSITDVTVSFEENKGHIDFITLNGIAFKLTAGGDEPTVQTVNPNYFIVPEDVTLERSYHMSSPEAAILNILPIVVIAGSVMIGLYIFVNRK